MTEKSKQDFGGTPISGFPRFLRIPLFSTTEHGVISSVVPSNLRSTKRATPLRLATPKTPSSLGRLIKTPGGLSSSDRNVEFIKEKHRDVLKSLYEEIESLKLENRGMSYNKYHFYTVILH